MAATFSPDTLRAEFDKVCDPCDWRAPISYYCVKERVAVVCAAIAFMTATEPVVTNAHDGVYLVTSEGYRMGPAGP
jgi:hypothetical protein